MGKIREQTPLPTPKNKNPNQNKRNIQMHKENRQAKGSQDL